MFVKRRCRERVTTGIPSSVIETWSSICFRSFPPIFLRVVTFVSQFSSDFSAGRQFGFAVFLRFFCGSSLWFRSFPPISLRVVTLFSQFFPISLGGMRESHSLHAAQLGEAALELLELWCDLVSDGCHGGVMREREERRVEEKKGGDGADGQADCDGVGQGAMWAQIATRPAKCRRSGKVRLERNCDEAGKMRWKRRLRRSRADCDRADCDEARRRRWRISAAVQNVKEMETWR
ncbi:hypothetical protein BDY17DRAFT_59915 [Neohortaea acidophila]|uniref:Uncharacterized protein n=1 Tax=Neohortaea acidophila TaxID=245834 RepID=A0A6A6PGB7_9PEZI|nr:uncharacterized protein BDY17DRAFT_59915 [Neohortaea acidophila]KAF2478826.1 hypothetical protein BDY17DRAFT_59915 [Neohortaea acidophila]